jgi:hypothetical protein
MQPIDIKYGGKYMNHPNLNGSHLYQVTERDQLSDVMSVLLNQLTKRTARPCCFVLTAEGRVRARLAGGAAMKNQENQSQYRANVFLGIQTNTLIGVYIIFICLSPSCFGFY